MEHLRANENICLCFSQCFMWNTLTQTWSLSLSLSTLSLSLLILLEQQVSAKWQPDSKLTRHSEILSLRALIPMTSHSAAWTCTAHPLSIPHSITRSDEFWPGPTVGVRRTSRTSRAGSLDLLSSVPRKTLRALGERGGRAKLTYLAHFSFLPKQITK